jgi:hypothetical protein
LDLPSIQATLARAGVEFDEGMTDREIADVEKRFGFQFPPDLRAFLQHALPISKGWMDWRHASEGTLRERLDWPYEGICFDVAHNVFWLPEWGARPSVDEEAFAIVKQALRRAPTLVPIASHRYIPDRPYLGGNPVFSVHQTDIIYYGCDLQEYLENEYSFYFGRSGYSMREPVRDIEFWSRLVG